METEGITLAARAANAIDESTSIREAARQLVAYAQGLRSTSRHLIETSHALAERLRGSTGAPDMGRRSTSRRGLLADAAAPAMLDEVHHDVLAELLR